MAGARCVEIADFRTASRSCYLSIPLSAWGNSWSFKMCKQQKQISGAFKRWRLSSKELTEIAERPQNDLQGVEHDFLKAS